MNDEESPPPEPEAVEIPSNSSLFVRISAAQNGQAEDLMAYHWKTLIDNCSFTFVDQTNGLDLRRAVKVGHIRSQLFCFACFYFRSKYFMCRLFTKKT